MNACTRILSVTRNFPPLVGSIPRLNYPVATGLSRRGGARGCPDSTAFWSATVMNLPIGLIPGQIALLAYRRDA